MNFLCFTYRFTEFFYFLEIQEQPSTSRYLNIHNASDIESERKNGKKRSSTYSYKYLEVLALLGIWQAEKEY